MRREDFPESFHQETVDYILAITTTPKQIEKKEEDDEEVHWCSYIRGNMR